MNTAIQTRSAPIQTRNAPANDNDATRAVEELRSAVEQHRTTTEQRITTELRALTDRLDDIEVRDQRGGGGGTQTATAAETELRALATFSRSGDDTELRAAASDNNVDGGYFVLPAVDLTIRTLLTDISSLRGLAEVVTISTDKYERFYSFGKRGAQWVTERGDRPQDTARPELKKHSYGVAELYAAPAATRHVLDDASVDIASWLVNNATQDFAETEGEAFWTGDGVDNSPKGLLTYGTTAEKDFTRPWGKHQHVASGDPAQFGGDALIKLIAALRKPYKSNARFIMNGATAVYIRTLKDADGRYLWAPTGNLIEGIEHPLLGYQVEIDDEMPDIAANSLPVAFGDFQQGYVIVDREGIRINRDELTQKGRVIFDTYKRVGGGAGDFNAIKFLKMSAN